MNTETQTRWAEAVKLGSIGGIAALMLALVGMVEAFSKRAIISGIISMGHTMLLFAPALAGYLVTNQTIKRLKEFQGKDFDPNLVRLGDRRSLPLLLNGGLAGMVSTGMVAIMLLIGELVNLRAILINASPELYDILTLGQNTFVGIILLLVLGAVLGFAFALIYLLPSQIRRAVLLGLTMVVLLGMIRDLIWVMLDGWGSIGLLFTWILARKGLSIPGAIVIFVIIAGGDYLWNRKRSDVQSRIGSLPANRQRTLRWGSWGAAGVFMLLLPQIVGSYPSEVLDMVGLYVLMGLGLNIVVGFAGLLDLGYVAFYGIGAYAMAILTSPEVPYDAAVNWTFGPFNLSFWAALPICILAAVVAGVILGIPVLGMRGDYLAIVTLGFGEIIRIVALSDWLKPQIGGSDGITQVPKAAIGDIVLKDPPSLYYLILAACLVAAFISWRLKDSRLGRSWMALREDEDVAEAMGINLVRVKLLAFATGAGLSGLAGAIFSSKLTSIYPHSLHLLVSINVLCLIIVGGIGSIPGVLVGSLALVGLPELLREFAEYRYLMYGFVLVLMMLARPEGLWPEERRKLELHEGEEEEEEFAPPSASPRVPIATSD